MMRISADWQSPEVGFSRKSDGQRTQHDFGWLSWIVL
jgi:hypothetical protein